MKENKMNYLIIGAGGMAGHLIAIYLKEQGESIEGIARRTLSYCNTHLLDVTDFEKLKNIIEHRNYDCIVNCVGLLNERAEIDIANAILINAYLPHYLAKITKNLHTKVIHLSTDCVFSGKKGAYSENDIPDGSSIYDRTKALGELNDEKNLTFRNSIIGPDINEFGIGLLNWFMKSTDKIYGYDKAIWTGVTTLTLAKAIHAASKMEVKGLYHLVNNEKICKYDLLRLLNEYSNKNLIIEKVDGLIQDKSLLNGRNDFSFVVPCYRTQVEELFEWMELHKELYKYSL